MVTTMVHGAPERLRSYELLAGVTGLRPPTAEADARPDDEVGAVA
jgi:hypothetical protein